MSRNDLPERPARRHGPISGMRAVMAVLIIAVAASTMAMDSEGKFAVWGVGRKACFSYSKDRKAGDGEKYRHYEMGYLTAYNALTDGTYNISGGMNLESVEAWLDDYCGKKPMNSFEQAISEFIHDHLKKRFRQHPSVINSR